MNSSANDDLNDYKAVLDPMLRAAIERLQDPVGVWRAFIASGVIDEMERLARAGRPPVLAAEDGLLKLGEWVNGHDAKRVFGRLAAFFVMSRLGFTQGQSGVRTPESRLFTKGTLFHPRDNPVAEVGRKFSRLREAHKRVRLEGGSILRKLVDIRSEEYKPDPTTYMVAAPISIHDFATLLAVSQSESVSMEEIFTSIIREAIEDMWDRFEEQNPEGGKVLAVQQEKIYGQLKGGL